MQIDFDAAKDVANLAKHGLRLARARDMDLANASVVPDDRHDYGELRFTAYDELDGRLHVMIFTLRDGRVRAISLRRANSREVKRYGSR